MNKPDCTVIGDAMVDLIFPLTNPEDLNYLFQGGVTSTKSKFSAGGTANVAVSMARLKGRPAFIGKIGNDCFGRILKKDLKVNRVKDCLKVSEIHNTGVAITIVQPDGERFFVVDRGANAYLERDDVDIDTCSNSLYLYISGYSFQDEKTNHTIQAIIKEVSDRVNIVFNPAAPNIAQRYKDEFIAIIKNYVDILILNEEEGKELMCGKDVFEELLPYTDVIALTRGKNGSIVAACNRIQKFKAYPVKVVDTTGAGDAYAAGLIYGLARGWSLDKVGDLATKIAGLVIGQEGARWNNQ